MTDEGEGKMFFGCRGRVAFFAVILTIIGLTLTGFLGGESAAQPEDIVLNHEGAFVKKRRSVVQFPHERHIENYGCLDCHHRYENGENVLDENELEEGNPAAVCSTCHGLETECDLHKAFHCLCLDCHIKESKAGRSSGPRQCKGCHTLKMKHH